MGVPPSAPVGAAAALDDETTGLLTAARAGDRSAYDRLFARVYDELRRVASRQASRVGADATISTTVLVHEAYLRLVGNSPMAVQDRAHFFALAARAMRHVLIDYARRGSRNKRGGGALHVSLDPQAADQIGAVAATPIDELLALDRALDKLAAVDGELGRLVEWRFFAGLTLEEIAALTGTSERTLKRNWQVARSFLLREIGGAPRAAATPR